MSLHIVRRAELPLSPWKNGGGVTRELYVATDSSGQPLWRLSMALVESSGPFSSYPGVRRVLVAVRGGPMRLHLGGEVKPLEPLQPLVFSGEAAAYGELLGSTLEDFNVMAWAGRVPEVQVAPAERLNLAGARAAVVLQGTASVTLGGKQATPGPVVLEYGDAVILPDAAEAANIQLSGTGQVAAVRILEPLEHLT